MNVRACYIAGPMRNRPQFNYPAFFAAEDALRAKGWQTFNPARMDGGEAPLNLDREAQEAHAGSPENARRYAARDIAVLLKLRAEDGDAIVMLDGWEQSTGAKAEVAVARWVGLKVLTLEEALR